MKVLLFDLDGTLIGRDGELFSGVAVQTIMQKVRQVQPEPNVIELMRTLASQFHIAVLSNGSPGKQRLKLQRSGLLPWVSSVVVSGDVGVAKPDRRFFGLALDRIGCTAQDVVMMVGDDPLTDIAGASACGIPSCWISRGRVYPPCVAKPDFVIDAVLDIEEVLPCSMRVN